MQLCLQDNLLACGQDCVLLNTTIAGNKTAELCESSKTEYCELAECCPACFGETQAFLDCEFTYEDADDDEQILCETECECNDVPDWHDAGGDAYGCEWYADDADTRCSKFGNSNAFKGFTANSACCVCKRIVDSSAPGVAATLAAMGGAIVAFILM